MLRILDTKGKEFAVITPKDVILTKNINELDTISFAISSLDENSLKIKGEFLAETKTDAYKIKAIDRQKRETRFEAVQNVDELKNKALSEGFKFKEVNALNATKKLLEGTVWTIKDIGCSSNTKNLTIEQDNSIWSAFLEIIKNWKHEFRVDTKNKVILLGEKIGSDKGVYFSNELNMHSFNLKVGTTELCTRLYPYGKDGVSIAPANGGKPYIEDFSYTTDIIEKVWTDDRFTIPANLLEEAKERLKVYAHPALSYEIEVKDLASINKEYEFLKYDIGDVITVIDSDSNFKDKQRVVEMVINLNDPKQNTVQLSSKIKEFGDLIEEVEDKQEDIRQDLEDTRQDVEDTKQDLEEKDKLIVELDKKNGILSSTITHVESNVKDVTDKFNDYSFKANKKFEELTQTHLDFAEEIQGAFKDGIIDETERKIITERLNDMKTEKNKMIAEYDKLYNHKNLEDTPEKKELETGFNKYLKRHESLKGAILSAIVDEKIDPLENELVKAETASYLVAIAEYKAIYIKALNKIGEKYSKEAEENAKFYASSKIEQTENRISFEVKQLSESVVTNTNDIKEAQQKITPDAIVSTVTKSTEYKDDMGNKVGKDTIISEINQTAEAIKISASKVELQGLVTFDNLTDGTTKISGDNIQTGTINGMRLMGTELLYMGKNGIMSCDGTTYIRNLNVPHTHESWEGKPGSFWVGTGAKFDKEVKIGGVDGELWVNGYNGMLGVIRRGKPAFIQIDRMAIQEGHYIEVAGYENSSVFGISIWQGGRMVETMSLIDEQNARSSNGKIGLDLIKALNHYSITHKNQEGRTSCGYNAEEFASINKNLSLEIPQQDGTIEIIPKTTELIPNMTLAMQEQQKQIEDLKAMVEEQQKQINELLKIVRGGKDGKERD